MDDVLEALATLTQRVEAQQYWLTQAYYLMSGNRPGLMANMIDIKIRALKNAPPAGPAHMSPADLDEIMIQELPAVLQVGSELANLLRQTQTLMDRERAAAAASVSAPASRT